MSRRSRKGSLSLSINAIVVLVIGIVVLGLSLGMIRSWFAKAGSEVTGLLDVSDIKSHADATKPINMPSEVRVEAKGTADVIVAYYNRGSGEVTTHPTIESCVLVNGEEPVPTADNVISLDAKVEGHTEQAYKIIIKAKDNNGQYLCSMVMDGTAGQSLASAPFTLYIGDY